ncbi:Serine/threonine-protein kinase smg1 [Entophlyctis luteolus]|nr:Serine/threonine-protein kinase smg1 [Entophlyctis luteolus]
MSGNMGEFYQQYDTQVQLQPDAYFIENFRSAPFGRTADSEGIGSLAQINNLFNELIFQPSYSQRIAAATELSNCIINAPIEGALEDINGTPEFKQSIVRIISALGFAFRYASGPFFEWVFDHMDEATERKNESNDFRIGLLRALKETLEVSFIRNPPKNLHEHLIDSVISNLESFLEKTTVPGLVSPAIDVFITISKMYPKAFKRSFQDFIALVIGWHIDPAVPNIVGNSIGKSFGAMDSLFWNDEVQFASEVIENLSNDIANAYSQELSQLEMKSAEKSVHNVSSKLLGLFRCCVAMVSSICSAFADDESVSIETSPKSKLILNIQTLADVISKVASSHPLDRSWKGMGA